MHEMTGTTLRPATPANRFYTWRRAWRAEREGAVAGGLIGGPVAGDDVTEGRPPAHVPLVELENRAPGHRTVLGLAVLPEHRGKGIARALLRHAVTLAREARAAGLSIVVEDTNPSAIALYESKGYRQQETRPWVGYGGRSGPRNWVMLARPLPP